MLYQLSYSRPNLTDNNGAHTHFRAICSVYIWWRGEDSNLRRLRRQIYSLFPLTAREPLHTNRSQMTENKSQKNLSLPGRWFPVSDWSWRWDLNPQPPDYKSGALPIELRQPEPEKYIRKLEKINSFFVFPLTKKAGGFSPPAFQPEQTGKISVVQRILHIG